MSDNNTSQSNHVEKLLILLKGSEEDKLQALSLLEAIDDDEIFSSIKSCISLTSTGKEDSTLVVDDSTYKISEHITFVIHLAKLNLISLSQVTTLNLKNISTEVLREVCSSFTELEHISIESYYWNGQSITKLPKELELCTKLKTLELIRQDGLTEVEVTTPLSIEKFSALSITHELVEALIPLMPNLTSMTIKKKWWRDKGLTSIPESIANLKKLQHLAILDHNTIQSIPPFLQDLHDLRSIDFSRCYQLKQLPLFLSTMNNLVYINISRTSIQYIPNKLLQRDSLQSIKAYSIYGLILLNTPEFFKKVKIGKRPLTWYPHSSYHRSTFIFQEYIEKYVNTAS